ncbi:hypothetical protein GALMADRAFT_454513 [Galerina marginata CBS 339.88]|uniref:Uncharacterized protein n=1 Tax=Galerina marginata (strain CBS 339.88) TaxID=685588 RepID=A0A067T0S1_GALM3|nr:hypothetical protein GALMADRAFT_454513 [Galerina marginata CBS 339.88]
MPPPPGLDPRRSDVVFNTSDIACTKGWWAIRLAGTWTVFLPPFFLLFVVYRAAQSSLLSFHFSRDNSSKPFHPYHYSNVLVLLFFSFHRNLYLYPRNYSPLN